MPGRQSLAPNLWRLSNSTMTTTTTVLLIVTLLALGALAILLGSMSAYVNRVNGIFAKLEKKGMVNRRADDK
jgi:hypothetical protein